MKGRRTLLVCTLILLAAAGVTTAIFLTEPEAERVGATKKTAMLVEIVEAERGTYRPTILAMGTVRPTREVVLEPRIEGEIVERVSGFDPGGYVKQGDRLLRIDPSDYENALEQAQSELHRTEADLELEMGRQAIAEREYRLLGDDLLQQNERLILREPQLGTARSMVEAARAAVGQARLELGRTSVEAPFDAHVLTREVDLGSQVAPGETLGRLVGVDAYWVEATIPRSKLRWISFGDPSGAGAAQAKVHDPAAWPEGETRTGRVDRLIGSLDRMTRLARVLVTVPDPLTLEPGSRGEPELMIGAFVEVRILADELKDVVRLQRDHLRTNDTAWVMEEGVLHIRELTIALRDSTYAYVTAGLEQGEKIVATNLTTVVDGAPLRTEVDGEGDGPDESPEAGETEAP